MVKLEAMRLETPLLLAVNVPGFTALLSQWGAEGVSGWGEARPGQQNPKVQYQEVSHLQIPPRGCCLGFSPTSRQRAFPSCPRGSVYLGIVADSGWQGSPVHFCREACARKRRVRLPGNQ